MNLVLEKKKKNTLAKASLNAEISDAKIIKTEGKGITPGENVSDYLRVETNSKR